MATLMIFCSPSELEELIRVVSREFSLSAVSFRPVHDGGCVFEYPTEITIYGDEYKIFLFPGDSPPPPVKNVGDVRQREWGWIGIDPGLLKVCGAGRVLLLTQVGGEDREIAPMQPVKYIRWLKRQVKRMAEAGVIAGDAGRLYRDIWHTAGARELLGSGVLWKQFVTGNSVFKPLQRK